MLCFSNHGHIRNHMTDHRGMSAQRLLLHVDIEAQSLNSSGLFKADTHPLCEIECKLSLETSRGTLLCPIFLTCFDFVLIICTVNCDVLLRSKGCLAGNSRGLERLSVNTRVCSGAGGRVNLARPNPTLD